MAGWGSSGDVLRWWRSDVLSLTQQDAADRLNVKPSALSNWERGTRSFSLELETIDEALKGDEALAGLLWGFGTPEGFDSGVLWSNVYLPPSRPVWLWVRSPSPTVSLQGEWGLARIGADLELGPNGAFITLGAFIPYSPPLVYLSTPGWCDFGYGRLPESIPGAPIVDAAAIFGRSSADGAFMEMFASSLDAKLSSRRPEIVDLANAAPDAVYSYLTRRGRRGPGAVVPRRWPPEQEGIEVVERARYARLRRARNLSLSAMADRLNNETGIDIGRDTLRRFETDVGRPHDPMLPVALDHSLRAGGRLALLEIRTGRGTGATWFPPYWRGPSWIQLDDPAGERQMVLRHGTWYREVTFTGPTLLAWHVVDPSLPLRVEVDSSTSWSVGVGRRAGADAIDQNWTPDGVEAAQQALAELEDAIKRAVECSRKDD